MTVDAFFAFARERHSIYLRRAAGLPAPWTDDPVLRVGRFTNVFRELDRTTVWFREKVRDPLCNKPEVLLATVVFRWFNRVTTGEAIFCQPNLFDGKSAFETFVDLLPRAGREGSVDALRSAILRHCGDGPYVTGAYTINTISAGVGLSKLQGVLRLIEIWVEGHPDWWGVARQMEVDSSISLQEFCSWVQSPSLGPFMAYEVACDLRHTALLEHAPDVLTWANLGPGARRGLNRVYQPEVLVDRSIPEADALRGMQHLLDLSRDHNHWPVQVRNSDVVTSANEVFIHNRAPAAAQWPAWELREVEHTLCEFDKYQRVRSGKGQTRGTFRYGAAREG